MYGSAGMGDDGREYEAADDDDDEEEGAGPSNKEWAGDRGQGGWREEGGKVKVVQAE